MKRIWLLSLAGLAGFLTATLMLLGGCGGSGGPITAPETGPAPSISAQFLELLPAAQKDATYTGSTRCTGCHNDNYHLNWQNTKHFQKNVGCEQCHGPGSVHAANRTASLVRADMLTLPEVQEPLVCGQCHGPTFEQFKNSRHAGPVAEVIESAHNNPAGGKTCLRCHGSALKNQFINAAWTKGMVEGKSITQLQNEADAAILALTNDQITALATASHQSANCATCHDPHTQTGNLTSTGNEAHLRRQTFSKDTAPAAPGSPVRVYSNFNHICATCHNARGGDPADAKLQTGTARPNMHDGPQFNMLNGITGSLPPGTVVQNSSHLDTPDQCVHCHMPDKRHTFTVSLDRSCIPCHTATDASTREATVRNEILTGLLVLRTRMQTWAQGKFGKPDFWNYYTLVSEDPAIQDESKAIQDQIPIEIKRARHNYFFITRDGSFGVHNTPYARQLLAYSQGLLDDLGISRSVKVDRSVKQMELILKLDKLRELRSMKNGRPDDL